MKRLSLFVVLAASAILAGNTNAQIGNNLLAPYNPSFEDGFTDWGGSGFANASLDTGAPGAGNYSARLAASATNTWNVIVDTSGTIPVTAGYAYILTAQAHQDVVGAIAQTGLNELNTSGVSTYYTWNTVSGSTWNTEYLTVIPQTTTEWLRVYLWVQPDATSGYGWWDDLRLDGFPNPFATTGSNASVQVSLPTVVFNRSGTTITPATLTPAIKLGSEFVGGVVAWNIMEQTSGTGGTPVLQDAYPIAQSGTWQWPINMDQLASLGDNRYFLNITAVTADGHETGVISKPLAVVSSISSIGTGTQSAITSSVINSDGLLTVNGEPYQTVMYYETTTTNFATIRSLGSTSVEVTGNSISALASAVNTAWSAGLYSWVVLFQPPFVSGSGSTTVWNTGTLQSGVDTLKTLPGVLGWVLDDEPDGNGIPPSVVQTAYNAIKAVDEDHVVWVNFTRQSEFADYTGCSDFASYDDYPFPMGSLTTINSMNSSIIAAQPGKPLISVLQGWALTGFPSFSQLRAELYTDVCDGMIHSFYYCMSSNNNCLLNQPEIESYTQLLNWEMKQLQPALLSGDAPLSVVVSNSNVRAVARTVGTQVIVVMVNQSNQPVEDVTATVAGRSFTSNSAFFPGTSPGTLDSGQIEDSLPSYGVGVYELQ